MKGVFLVKKSKNPFIKECPCCHEQFSYKELLSSTSTSPLWGTPYIKCYNCETKFSRNKFITYFYIAVPLLLLISYNFLLEYPAKKEIMPFYLGLITLFVFIAPLLFQFGIKELPEKSSLK